MKHINVKKLCMGCMKERHSANELCPYCGFDEEEYTNTHTDCLPPRTVLYGKFIVGKTLGNGGFGKTYVAFDSNINRKVCIKELFPAYIVTRGKNNEVVPQRSDEDEFENYKAKAHDETLRLSEFNDLPGVVSVRDYFEENNTAYIVMDFVEGENLREYLLRNGGKLSLEWVLKAMKPVMESLAEIHDANVIHRDISPDNLMLTKNGELVLIDFGAAREFSYDTTHTVTTILKHGYAPIEQYSRSGKQGPWTDIYALAATIYRMITGKVLAESTDRAMSKEQPFDGLDDIVDKKTIRALTKALAVDYNKRYQFIENFYRALYGKNIPGYVSVNKLLEQADKFQENADYENANKLYFKATRLGNAEAMLRIAGNYECGNGVEQDYAKANEWYLKAAELGDVEAMRNLAINYELGYGVEKDYAKVNEWYLKAAERGDASAMTMLGCNYEYGNGVEQDYAKANEWYLKAAELGEGISMLRLGYHYDSGQGVEQDYAKANGWYLKAAELGIDYAMMRLANNYEWGNGVEQSYERANEWFLRAAELGNEIAMNNLGYNYDYGYGVEQDYAKANEWYLEAAERGSERSMYHLGHNYFNGNGVEKDYKKANEWYLKAAELGDVEAMRNLAINYELGYGVEKDYAKVNEWYLKAAERGDADAMDHLGFNYDLGRGVKLDYAKANEWHLKANEWYLKAAERGDEYAMLRLAWHYELGFVVEQDYEKANEWRLKAAELGDVRAMWELADNYERGYGVGQDYEKAAEWYQKAMDAGYEEAKVYLENLRKKMAEQK